MAILRYYLVVPFFASTALSQATIPTCAQACYNNAITSSGCSNIDVACICNNSDVISTAGCCVQDSCAAADQIEAISYVQSLCSSAGVTISGLELQCESNTQSSSSSSAAAPSATSSPNPTSTPTPTPSTSSSVSSSSSSTTTTSSSSSSSSASTTPAANSASSSSPISSPSNTPLPTRSRAGRLSTGAKAGIGIAAALIVIILLILAFCVYGRRKNEKRSGTNGGSENHEYDTSRGHELPTKSNIHELIGAGTAADLEKGKGYDENAFLAEKSPGERNFAELSPASPTSPKSELLGDGPAPMSPRIMNVYEAHSMPYEGAELAAEHYYPQEIGFGAGGYAYPHGTDQATALAGHEGAVAAARTAAADAGPVGAAGGVGRGDGTIVDEAKEARVAALQAKLAKVRADKEQLSRMQELERMEEELKAEVLREMRS